MRKLGLIGGMTWVSTRNYYEQINRIIQRRIDKKHSAPMLIESLDFSKFYTIEHDATWDEATDLVIASARRLETAGAEGLVIAANMVHRIYDRVAGAVNVPVLHIAEATGAKMAADGVKKAALLGTRGVMTESFYRRRLVAHNIDLEAPIMEDVEILDRYIFEELKLGRASRQAERALKTMITQYQQDGVDAIVLACAELEQVVDVDANILPIYDTSTIHAQAAAEWILEDGNKASDAADQPVQQAEAPAQAPPMDNPGTN